MNENELLKMIEDLEVKLLDAVKITNNALMKLYEIKLVLENQIEDMLKAQNDR